MWTCLIWCAPFCARRSHAQVHSDGGAALTCSPDFCFYLACAHMCAPFSSTVHLVSLIFRVPRAVGRGAPLVLGLFNTELNMSSASVLCAPHGVSGPERERERAHTVWHSTSRVTRVRRESHSVSRARVQRATELCAQLHRRRSRVRVSC